MGRDRGHAPLVARSRTNRLKKDRRRAIEPERVLPRPFPLVIPFFAIAWRRAAVYTAAILTTLPWTRGPALALATWGDAIPFSATIPRLAYHLLPWSPLLAFALVRPQATVAARVAHGLTLGLLVVESVLAREGGSFAPPLLALSAGIFLADLDERERPLPALALGLLAGGALLAHDLSIAPARVLASPAQVRAVRLALFAAAAPTAFALLASASWLRTLRIGRGTLIAATGLVLGVFIRARGLR